MSAESTPVPPAAESAGTTAFDEGLAPDGKLRPHWELLRASFGRLGLEELGNRAENCRRLLGEHAVTCFVAGKDGGRDEPWQLDLMPLAISAGEWREVAAGLKQRAHLLNLILADLYGTQRLVRDGFVPAPLVFANPGYWRACQGVAVPGGVFLHLYAADLARSPDGRWWVVADRTQAPSGLGLALENRSILSRVLPEAMRDVQPRPLSDTLRIHRETLRRLAPAGVENPSIALLTPGARHEAYFEHAYLARLLGLTLVEGDDLTVRDRRLFIKTLDGLRRADVLLRRLDDSFCDPLELRGDSLLGVPGLVEAARAGCVTVSNALGSGLLESPAFLPFLPAICRHLLQEELRLPSLATWWCGEANEQNYVRAHLDELVVHPAFSFAGAAIRPAGLSRERRAMLVEDLRLRPHEFVAQENLRLSCAPVWSPAPRAAQPFLWRTFVLRDGPDFALMPGGLARVLDDTTFASSTIALSGLSKDVWVLPDGTMTEPVRQVIATPQPALERAPSDLPSRSADNFFWLGRYSERLEQIVRVARTVVRCLSDDPNPAARGRLEALRAVLERLGMLARSAAGQPGREALQKEVLLLLYQEGHPAGVRDLLKRIHVAAFSVRDRLSADTWRILNRLEPDARQRPGRLPLVQASATLHTLVFDLAAFAGMEMENMTRGHGWAFLDIGRRLERGMFAARFLEAICRRGPDFGPLLEPALEIGDSVMTHRRRYFAEPRLVSVMEVLMLDPTNPRSLAFQLGRLETHAAALPAGMAPDGVALVQERVGQLGAMLRACQFVSPAEEAAESEAVCYAELLAKEAAGLGALSDLLTQVFFSHVTPQVS